MFLRRRNAETSPQAEKKKTYRFGLKNRPNLETCQNLALDFQNRGNRPKSVFLLKDRITLARQPEDSSKPRRGETLSKSKHVVKPKTANSGFESNRDHTKL